MLEFMGKHGLEEFEYERESFRIRLKKTSHNSGSVLRSAMVPEIVMAAPRDCRRAVERRRAERLQRQPGIRAASVLRQWRRRDARKTCT